jgi:hypothetical protein
MIGAFGGFPTPPKIFARLTRHKFFQWCMVWILLFQGGAERNTLLATVMTFIGFLVFTLLNHYEDNVMYVFDKLDNFLLTPLFGTKQEKDAYRPSWLGEINKVIG